MARYTGPTTRISRRFGQLILGSGKAFERRNYPPGQHGPKSRRKFSEYAVGLNEKQKLRYIYGLLERQFRRVFEIANRFIVEDSGVREQKMLAGIALGARLPEQWGSAATTVDFYDVRGDLSALLTLGGALPEFDFEPAAPGYLHPGRGARIVRNGAVLGLVGELHPRLVRAFDLTYAPILFEFEYSAAFRANLAQFREVSRFPQIRRDISFTVPVDVAFATLSERVSVAAGSLLKQLSAFDVYQGKGVEIGRKSIALGLILQDLSRTLTDDEADRVVHAVLQDLGSNLDARIRE